MAQATARMRLNRPKHIMTTGAYFVVAQAIKQIEDEPTRKRMADHFAQFFNDRSQSFDNHAWFKATGGLAKAKTEAAAKAKAA